MHNEEGNLYITSVHAMNLRKFKEINVEFNRGFNFLVGPNGSGKTSILRAIAMCLSHSSIEDSRIGDSSELWTDFTCNNRNYRIGFGTGWAETTSYRSTRFKNLNYPASQENRQSFVFTTIKDVIPVFAPLFIGAYRKFSYQLIQGMSREEGPSQRREFYRDNAAASLNGTYLPNVKQWLINRYFIIDKEWAEIEKVNWNWLLLNLKLLAPADSDFSFIEIGRELEPKFSLYGKETYLEELSSGFQSILSIVLSIFEWVESTNEREGQEVRKAKGTVIIDELDVHLHPEWQLTISKSLKTIFPELQFIVTTHSPHIIASAESGEIITIPSEDTFNVKPKEQSYSGWTTDQILEDIMNVNSLENKIYSQLINQAYNFIKKEDKNGLKETLLQMENIIHPADTVAEVLKMKLAQLNLTEEEGN
ncbi:AAA family ATPase [Planococcus sp. NCCP-2050]|uniref:AAA family ATPase n=1 Tax=Planococcus sp. NCCP-2050 TaxID=2944679 RepID=UPI00203D6F96|nr:ATP-binding protein [Planococcus sp. NCCP-2050]GKW47362.1 hypothetical protein NCCP2050_30540 [Planococcus sp. NCCP-2050]